MGCSCSPNLDYDSEKTTKLHMFVAHSINNGKKLHKNVFVYRNLFSFGNQYSINDEIGQGAFGKTFTVKHIQSGEIRCCKIIKNKSAEIDERLSSRRTSITRRFHQIDFQDESILEEIKILSILDHPNIIKIYEYFVSGGQYYIILEYVDGVDLKKYLASAPDNKIKPEEVFSILNQVLYALSYMHSKRIVHRDIKAENIMITKSNNQIKIVDFGCSCYLQQGGLITRRAGSLCYLAPEVIGNNYSFNCDVWSLGILTLLLVKGRFPVALRGNEDQIEQNILKLSSCQELIEDDNISLLNGIINDMLIISFRKRESSLTIYQKYFVKDTNVEIKLSPKSKLYARRRCTLIMKLAFQLAINQSTLLLTLHTKTHHLNNLFQSNDTNGEGLVMISPFKKVNYSEFIEIMLCEEISTFLKESVKKRNCMYVFTDIYNKQGYTLDDILSICKLKKKNCPYKLDFKDINAKYTKEDHTGYMLSQLEDFLKEGSCCLNC